MYLLYASLPDYKILFSYHKILRVSVSCQASELMPPIRSAKHGNPSRSGLMSTKTDL